MNKSLFLGIGALLALALAGCGGQKPEDSPEIQEMQQRRLQGQQSQSSNVTGSERQQVGNTKTP